MLPVLAPDFPRMSSSLTPATPRSRNNGRAAARISSLRADPFAVVAPAIQPNLAKLEDASVILESNSNVLEVGGHGTQRPGSSWRADSSGVEQPGRRACAGDLRRSVQLRRPRHAW